MQTMHAVTEDVNWFGQHRPVASVELFHDNTFKVVFSYLSGKIEIAVPVIDYDHGKAIIAAFNRTAG